MSKVLLKISGSQFYTPKVLTEVLLTLPPLELILEMMIIKFNLKCLALNDDMKCLIAQLEETPNHIFYSHIMSTKQYLIWKRKCNEKVRSINFTDIPDNQLKYTKIDILLYQCHKWDRLIANNDMIHFGDKHDPRGIGIEQKELVNTLIICQSPLFLRTDRRVDNSNMLDFLL